MYARKTLNEPTGFENPSLDLEADAGLGLDDKGEKSDLALVSIC